MKQSLKNTASLTAIAFLQTSLFALVMGSEPALARRANQFDICIDDLSRTGISLDDSAVACSGAVEPRELGRCVQKINYTSVNPNTALEACYRVRRPVELGDCVFKINREDENSDPNSVVDFCRRSLVPLRFSECVIALNQASATTELAMQICLAPEDFPRETLPNL